MDKPIAIPSSALEQYQIKQPEETKDQGKIGQEAFFKLMVTQLENQDPLKPMESGDYLGQIAQFSTVSGIDELGNSFAALASSMQSSQALQASTMVGRQVVLPSNTLQHSGHEAVGLSAELPSAASSVRVTIADASGQVVQQAALGPHNSGRLRYTWDGRDTGGQQMPAGNYSVRFDAAINGQQQALEPAVTARVDSVTLSRDGQGPTLNVDGFGATAMSAVIEIL